MPSLIWHYSPSADTPAIHTALCRGVLTYYGLHGAYPARIVCHEDDRARVGCESITVDGVTIAVEYGVTVLRSHAWMA